MYRLQRNHGDRRKNKPALNVTQELVQFTEQERLELKKTTVSLKPAHFRWKWGNSWGNLGKNSQSCYSYHRHCFCAKKSDFTKRELMGGARHWTLVKAQWGYRGLASFQKNPKPRNQLSNHQDSQAQQFLWWSTANLGWRSSAQKVESLLWSFPDKPKVAKPGHSLTRNMAWGRGEHHLPFSTPIPNQHSRENTFFFPLDALLSPSLIF